MADPTTPDGLVGDPNAASVTNNLTGNTPAGTFMGTSSSVATNADYIGGTNIANVSSDIIRDPAGFLGSEGTLADNIPTVDANAEGTSIDNNNYNVDVDALQGSAQQGATGQAASVTAPTTAPTYTAQTTAGQVGRVMDNLDAATATVGNENLVNEATIDLEGLATGTNADGSVNATGRALNTVFTQDISRIVDTSTVSGQLLADRLGEGNYTDAKTQTTYWLDELSKDFVDPATGQPKIPSWAAGALRGVNRMIAFKGVTGTAAMGAVAAATMEAMVPIAQDQANFFRTMTAKNLDAKNTQALQTAQILANMNLAEMDARMEQAVFNAKTFVQYDLTNVANEQQVELVRAQAKQQAIMEDANQVNVQRRFNAENKTQVDQFYTQLGAQIDQFNVTQRNGMTQFNAGQANDMTQFNLQMENQREQFYLNMQNQIDMANAQWRQKVTLTNAQMAFDAAATDVKNIVGLTSEQLNQMWDRSDSLLDYAWREGESQKDRNVQIQVAKMNYDAQVAAANAKKKGFGSVIGSIAGNVLGGWAGSTTGSAAITTMLGFSDERLKDNIVQYGELDNGIKLFKWEWNDKAKKLGADKWPTYGVVAQDVQKIIPDAVRLGKNGYLTVDYNKVVA